MVQFDPERTTEKCHVSDNASTINNNVLIIFLYMQLKNSPSVIKGR